MTVSRIKDWTQHERRTGDRRHSVRRRSTTVAVFLSIAIAVGIVGSCGDGDDRASTTSTSTTSTTDTQPATATVEAVVAGIQAQFDADFDRSTPPAGVTGPTELVCTDSGPIEVGTVFGCSTRTPTEPEQAVEEGGVVVYVLQADGTAAYDVATDIPGSTEQLLEAYGNAPTGLFCRDLRSEEIEAYPFRQLSTPGADYFWSLVYWSLEGRPDRMDADLNGIPCETLYDEAVVAGVLAGGRVP